ncbi:MAG: class B sortase [Clostridiales bacterium]|nr:class B sortase [Clostridiales bacterium]
MKRFLDIANGIVSACLITVLLLGAAYAGFALWDNRQIYAAAEGMFEEMSEIMSLSGDTEASENVENSEENELAAKFQQLQEINPDVTAWLTVFGTAIDYPLMQGISNLTYLNKDVYGEFSMTGSVYLDTRNARDYTDIYNLVYGHNMSRHRMLSDINLFKNEEFFNENQTGILLLPERGYILQAVSYFLTTANNSQLFNPENWDMLNSERILEYVQKDAMYISQTGLDELTKIFESEEQPRLLALSTCSPESDDARTILVMLILP